MFIVFDIGGTNTRIASSVDGTTVSEPVIYPTPKTFEEGIVRFVEVVHNLANGTAITAVAGGIAGPMDTKKSMLRTAPNIPDWNNKPLKQELETRLQAKVFLENDTAMWGLGEALHGAGKGKVIVVYITVSTGVGGCRIVNGKIDVNAYGFEPGHMIINPEGPVCGCGGKGHLEAYTGGLAMERRLGKKAEHIHESAIWEKEAKYLAIGMLNISVMWSPHIIILGGSMMKSVIKERIEYHMNALNTVLPIVPTLAVSTLKDRGGLIGSLVYARSMLQ